ncbi:hypothetical protein [Zavarzinella formosa]|uniref:hypothetical protein n=1 Tax=Zavarzinella formosa TaxID=360055 RepID=UPI0003194E06|nr:hypothetical protein [Zavarzinella formosa]
MTIKTELMTITPAKATAWLDKSNFSSRRLDDSNVNKIIRDIKNNKWVFDGNPIRFDTKGNVIDGQHRLWAVVMANKSVEMLVLTGLDHKAVDTIDSGKSRSISDIFHFNGHTNNTTLAALCRLAIGYEKADGDMWKWATSGAKVRLTAQELLDKARNNTQAFESTSFVIGLKHVRKMAGPGLAAFVHYILTLETNESWRVDNFFNTLNDGTNLEPTSPVLVLRNKLSMGDSAMTRNNSGDKATAYKIALIFKAWNAYRKDKPVARLRFDQGNEAFPTLTKQM